jgi:hypothetical protein
MNVVFVIRQRHGLGGHAINARVYRVGSQRWAVVPHLIGAEQAPKIGRKRAGLVRKYKGHDVFMIPDRSAF